MLVNALKYAVAKIYGGIQAQRAACYAAGRCKAHRLPCKVVCVGNLAAGGTGKTPAVMYLANLLHNAGVPVVILSRGYKGALEKEGGLVSNGQKVLVSAQEAGDEPYLLACRVKGVPVYVGRNRYANGLKAIKAFNPKVILLDDGYQHLQLQRNLNLVLMDAASPLGNGRVIPMGPLREKPAALNRAQAIIFTRGQAGQNCYAAVASFISKPLPHFVSGHRSYGYLVSQQSDLQQAFVNAVNFKAPQELMGPNPPKVFAFAGIAKNQSFLNGLKAQGFNVAGHKFFADHYAYTPQDLEELQQQALKAGATVLVTTEKDHAKLKGRLNMDLAVFGVQLDFFGKEREFAAYLFSALNLTNL